jgi:choline dehydrogenase-like flavoprotein
LPTDIPNLERLQRNATAPIALQHLPWSDQHGQPVRVATTHLPRFSASPHGTLACDATATRILCDDDGRITGIRFQSLGEAPRTVRARAYVIACGGIESARLLLLSRCARFPHGLGNQSEQVGRCFMEHPSVAVGTGTVRGVWNPWSYRERAFSEQFLADAKRQGLGGVRLRWLATRSGLGLDPAHPLQSVGRGMRAVRELSVDLKAQIEMEPSPANRVTLTGSVADAFGNPGADLRLAFTENDRRTIRHAQDLIRRTLAQVGAEQVEIRVIAPLWDHHHMGTCRMGDDPGTSVVDRDLRVHGVDDLYVAGSAPFVTSSVSNPTLTIAALSLRLADHLTGRLRPVTHHP